MTITKNDFFTANNFKSLQDISKVYPEWKDFCMTIVSQMDDKFDVTMASETSAEVKQLFFGDYNTMQRFGVPGITATDLQKGKLYLYKYHATASESGQQILDKELYDTGVSVGEMPTYIKGKNVLVDGVECNVITIQNDDTFNVGDTLLSLDTLLADSNGQDIRYDYNGALYEVVKVEGKDVYLRTKNTNINTPFQETQALYLYNKAK